MNYWQGHRDGKYHANFQHVSPQCQAIPKNQNLQFFHQIHHYKYIYRVLTFFPTTHVHTMIQNLKSCVLNSMPWDVVIFKNAGRQDLSSYHHFWVSLQYLSYQHHHNTYHQFQKFERVYRLPNPFLDVEKKWILQCFPQHTLGLQWKQQVLHHVLKEFLHHYVLSLQQKHEMPLVHQQCPHIFY